MRGTEIDSNWCSPISGVVYIPIVTADFVVLSPHSASIHDFSYHTTLHYIHKLLDIVIVLLLGFLEFLFIILPICQHCMTQ